MKEYLTIETHRSGYSGHPAISRKDNKTEICPLCGTGEALMDFIDNIQKNKATD